MQDQGTTQVVHGTVTDHPRIDRLPEVKRTGGQSIHGYIYIVEFTNGTIKVGKTCNPKARIQTHSDNGRPFGVSISKLWLSDPHRNYSENERELLESMGRGEMGNEYYIGRSFIDVHAAAQNLTFVKLSNAELQEIATERKEKASRFAESLLGPRGRTTVTFREDVNPWPIASLFGIGDQLPAPAVEESVDVDMLVQLWHQFSDASGIPFEEISSWSYLDLVRYLAETQLETQLIGLEIAARKADRADLLEPYYLDLPEVQLRLVPSTSDAEVSA